MTDHIHDSEINAALKRAEAAEREVARMRELYRIDGKMITVLGIMLVISMCVAACCIAALGTSRDHALDARDACEVQSQLYLDGWTQCKREADAEPAMILDTYAPPTSLYSFRDANHQIGYVDLAGKCHGKVPKKYCARSHGDGSMLDPARRVDR